MKFTLDLSQVKVVARTDHKGNPVICLDVLGHYVLYREWDRGDYPSPDEQAEALDSYIPSMFAGMLGRMFQAQLGSEWSTQSPTGREVDYHDTTIGETDV